MNYTSFTTFKDKVTVITGGTSGIGYQMVRYLSPYNTVIVISRPGSKLDALKKEFPNIKTFTADLSEPLGYEILAKQIIHAHPQIDVLINNAAMQCTPSFLDDDFSYESIVREINLNFTAVCSLSYLLLPALLNKERETIITNINSGLAIAPKTSSAIYCATKGAMNIFSQSLNYQFENTNIRVIQAFLPLVDTPMTEGRGQGKIAPKCVAKSIIRGIENNVHTIDVGKVKILRFLHHFLPILSRKIMKGS